MIFFFLSLFSVSAEYKATGFYNKETKTIDVEEGINKNGTCWAIYINSMFEDGWYKYTVEGREGADPNEMGYCAGYLEGYLAQGQIYDAVNLRQDSLFGSRYDAPPERFQEYMKKNLEWAYTDPKIQSNKNYQVFLNLFNGLEEGYNKAALPKNQTIERYILWSYSADGDLIDILPMIGIMKYSNPIRARCTAFIKLLPDYSDIFMSHNSWTDYRQLHAVIKSITLPIPFFNAKTVILSTRIGMCGSVDDFYVSDSNLMVFETTLLNCNDTYIKSFVTPQKLNYWVRANSAMFAAKGGSDWIDIFMADNSGTYNNDYYIIDVNKFVPGEKPTKDLVWLIEQTPSNKLYKTDVTENLTRKLHIQSFNVPVSDEIYDLMDYKKFADLNSLYVPFKNNSRYLIAERELPKVTTFEAFKHIGRHNHYKTDEYSNQNPQATIACRNELNTSELNDDFFQGALDNKVCRASEVFTKLNVHIINGPTNEGGEVPTFTFNFDRLKDYPHDGLPDEFNFDYIQFTSDNIENKCEKITDKKKCLSEENKFCGWCGGSGQCLAGSLAEEGPLFGKKCEKEWTMERSDKEGYTWVIVGCALAGTVVVASIVAGFVCYRLHKTSDEDIYDKIKFSRQ